MTTVNAPEEIVFIQNIVRLRIKQSRITFTIFLTVSFGSGVINQSTFYFHDAKEGMWVATKDQSVIEFAVFYCSKLTTQKLPNATM